jgi:hypothetical protein
MSFTNPLPLTSGTLDHDGGAPILWFGVIAGKRRRPVSGKTDFVSEPRLGK